MQPFSYHRASSAADAVRSAAAQRTAASFIAGGTTLADYMKLGAMRPDHLIDINPLQASEYARIEAHDGGLRLGALARMAQVEDHPQVAAHFPLIRDTLVLAATRQIRNMASLGGNLLQRTRCEYFRETSWACNKRAPGSGCSAREGVNRQLAVLGTSDACIATYPGDFAQALVALDATVETAGSRGGRKIRVAELHREPGATPQLETVLEPGELITFIDVPAGPWTARSRYVKVRDRTSYQFALASAAVALQLDGDTVREARIALGGVATRPWRSHEAEAVLRGHALDEASAGRAAQAAFASAKSWGENAFKIPLGRETLVRALLETKSMELRA